MEGSVIVRVWSTASEFGLRNWEYPLKTWGRMANLVVGDIQSRTLEVYCFCLWISGKGRESLRRLCVVQGWVFRVVIVNRNTAGLELWSGKDGVAICLLIYMLQTSAVKINSSWKKYGIQTLNSAVNKCLWYYSSAAIKLSSRHTGIFSSRISFCCGRHILVTKRLQVISCRLFPAHADTIDTTTPTVTLAE